MSTIRESQIKYITILCAVVLVQYPMPFKCMIYTKEDRLDICDTSLSFIKIWKGYNKGAVSKPLFKCPIPYQCVKYTSKDWLAIFCAPVNMGYHEDALKEVDEIIDSFC